MTSGEFFERAYRSAARDRNRLGWTRPGAAQILTDWLEENECTPAKAIVVGCGVGDDAQHLASLGWDVTAFDISPSAIEWARERVGGSAVDYRVADLFDLPEEWTGAFDLVVEVWTLQSIPPDRTAEAIRAIARLVNDGGTLLVAALTSVADVRTGGPPWPLDPGALSAFVDEGLFVVNTEETDTSYESVRNLEVEYRRP